MSLAPLWRFAAGACIGLGIAMVVRNNHLVAGVIPAGVGGPTWLILAKVSDRHGA